MPLYDFQCPCGLRFEAVASMKNATKTKVCPSCGGAAVRLVPLDLTSSFSLEISGPTPQNTGVYDLDTHIDRVIGQSAKQGWEVVDQRVQNKREILKTHPNATGHDLSRNPDGSYKVLAPEERAIHERANAINSLAMQELQKRKKQTHPSR